MTELKNAIVNGSFPSRKKYYPHIPRKLIEITEKCINIDADKRYQDVLDILNDMAKVNKNLDWVYKKENGVYNWINDDKVITMYKKDGKWILKCKIIIEFERSFDKLSDGFRYVRKIIKEDN